MTEDAGRLSPDGRWRWDGSRWKSTAADAPAARAAPPPTSLRRALASITDLRVERAADWRVPAAVAAAAVAADAALGAPRIGLAATLLVAVTGAALVASRRAAGRQALLLLALAALLAAGLTVRDSPWLVIPDAVTAAALVISACALTRAPGILDLSMAAAVAGWARALVHGAAGTAFAAGPVVDLYAGLRREHRTHAIAALRGLGLALPVVAVVTVLLAQADVVFASFFEVHANPFDAAPHVLYVALGALVMAGLCRAASAARAPELPAARWRLGRVEGLVVLAALDLVFAAFTAAQVVAATGAGAAAIREHGMTYAEYARSGFFQLLWVAGITLVLLLVLRAVVSREHAGERAFLVFAEIAVAFTLVIVAVAFQRLNLYESVYGFTMLRLYCQVFAGWIAVVYLALAVALTPLGRRRQWLLAAAAAAGVAGLLALNLVDPEALVVRLDVSEAHGTQRLDVDYLSSLSNDAVPALAAAIPGLDPADRQAVRERLCPGPPPPPGWAGYNASAVAAAAARAGACT